MILECKVPHSSTPDAFDIFTMASALGNIIQDDNLQVQGYDIVDFYDRYTKVSVFLYWLFNSHPSIRLNIVKGGNSTSYVFGFSRKITFLTRIMMDYKKIRSLGFVSPKQKWRLKRHLSLMITF